MSKLVPVIGILCLYACITICAVLLMMMMGGCQRGDFKATMVVEGQPSPHQGFNFGPESYVTEGDIVKVTGVVVWVKGLDPNTLASESERSE